VTDSYILQGQIPTPEPDLLKWSAWFETADRIVEQTVVTHDVKVSTVFLGIDHQFGDGPPLLFETMVFGGRLGDEVWRYSTWDEAVAGHHEAVKMVSSNNILFLLRSLLQRAKEEWRQRQNWCRIEWHW
jgi:hypothetical protein